MHCSCLNIMLTMISVGSITTNRVSLSSLSSFLTDPPNFTLFGSTSGGPPVNSSWSRDGVMIASGGPFSISLSVNETSTRRFSDSLYVSMLTVTSRLPGVYEYSASNRGSVNTVTGRFTIQGNKTQAGDLVRPPPLKKN